MSEDRNREKLEQALRNLPDYQPEETVWENIRLELEREVQQKKLQRALQTLPYHEPPEKVWDHIEAELERDHRVRLRSVRRMRMVAIAAVLATLTVAVPWLFSLRSNSQITIVYSTETAPPPLPTRWDEDEEAIALLVSTAESQPGYLISEYEKRLMAELEELTAAKTEIQEAIDRYGVNDQLAREMAEIERERTDILEEMAAQI